jgi:WhiB family redox-sensing transcriptional regulator
MTPTGRPVGAAGGTAGGLGPAAGAAGRTAGRPAAAAAGPGAERRSGAAVASHPAVADGGWGAATVRGREDLPHGLAAELAGWAWRLDAACGGLPSSMFFSPEGERGAARRRRERTAKAVCGTCVVREHCAAYALAYKERYGVWGGLSEHEREAIWYRRARDHASRQHESTNRQGGKAP